MHYRWNFLTENLYTFLDSDVHMSIICIYNIPSTFQKTLQRSIPTSEMAKILDINISVYLTNLTKEPFTNNFTNDEIWWTKYSGN